jgi:uncharacterized membrane protein
MLHSKASKFAILSAACLLGIGASRSAHAQWATEWSGGSVINLGSLPGGTGNSYPFSVNDAGQVVGRSYVGGHYYATEWSSGSVIDLGGKDSFAFSINDAGQVVGQSSSGYATEWSGGSVINLGGLPGSMGSSASSINDAGQVVGESLGGGYRATEWSGGSVINLGGLPGSTYSFAFSINDAGQVVGESLIGVEYATEWSGGSVINLGDLPGGYSSEATAINNAGQVVGVSYPIVLVVPEPSTWAMMLLGFAGLGFAGYRRERRAKRRPPPSPLIGAPLRSARLGRRGRARGRDRCREGEALSKFALLLPSHRRGRTSQTAACRFKNGKKTAATASAPPALTKGWGSGLALRIAPASSPWTCQGRLKTA